jgi:hypothetical protein
MNPHNCSQDSKRVARPDTKCATRPAYCEALTLVCELSHPSSSADVLAWSIPIYKLRREVRAVREQAEAVIVLCHP